MPCKCIHTDQDPYDESTVRDKFTGEACTGVQSHFTSNAINVDDCIRVNGQVFVVVAVKVFCEGSEIYSAGTVPTEGDTAKPPDHTHTYTESPVKIEFWLQPVSEPEVENCSGTPC